MQTSLTLAVVLLVSIPDHRALAGSGNDAEATGASRQAAWSSPLTLFQRVVSRADGDRCPMAPSCSHYAVAAFDNHHAVTAWILTCDRLLRCGHDEARLATKVWIDGKPRAFDPLTANTFWWRKP